jgi:CHAD domain-containing protein
LETPAEAACARLARHYLAAAARAARRLDDPSDAEALHDFRVALRRLRSLLRAYDEPLRAVPGKLRRRLKRVARATTHARDAEVQLEWLGHANRRQRGAAREAGEWWRARLETARDAAYAEVRAEVRQEFHELRERLRAVLATRRAPRRVLSLARTARPLIAHQAGALVRALEPIRSATQGKEIHSARIEGKRLRYLIEPLATALPAAARAVSTLKDFQDRFGSLCDAFVRARTLADVAAAAAAEPARGVIEDGLQGRPRAAASSAPAAEAFIPFAHLIREEIARGYADIERRYLGGRARSLFGSVDAVRRALRSDKLPKKNVISLSRRRKGAKGIKR